MDTCIFFGKGREVGFERLKRTSQLTCDQIGITKTVMKISKDRKSGKSKELKIMKITCNQRLVLIQ